MTRIRIGLLGIVVLTVAPLAAVWVLSRPGPRNDFTERVIASDHATTLQTGNGWVLETMQQEGFPCKRIRIGDRATMCTGLQNSPGSGDTITPQGLGHRFVLVAIGSTAPRTLALFSNRSAGDLHPMLQTLAGTQVVAVELQPGEEAWGYHVLDSKGGVVSNQSLLPP